MRSTGEILQNNTETFQPDILRQAHEAVATDYMPLTADERVVENYSEAAAAAPVETHHSRRGIKWLTAGLGAAALALAPSPAQAVEAPAQASTYPQPSLDVTATFKTERSRATVNASDISTGKVTILGNIRARGTPKRLEREAETCRTVNGRKNIVYTEGLSGPDRKGTFGRDFRKSRICLIDGQWIRVKCNNRVIFRKPKNVVEGRVLWVKNIARLDLNVKAKAVAVARCEEGGASAYAEGHGSAKARVRFKTFIKSRGNTAITVGGRAWAKAEAAAKAQVECESSEKIIEKPAEQPMNNPPSGEMKPPQHLYSRGLGKICVDNIKDPDGDPVKVHSFRVWREGDTQKQGIGEFIGDVYTEPGGVSQCQQYRAPYTEQDFKADTDAQLSDGRGGSASATGATYDFWILKDDFAN